MCICWTYHMQSSAAFIFALCTRRLVVVSGDGLRPSCLPLSANEFRNKGVEMLFALAWYSCFFACGQSMLCSSARTAAHACMYSFMFFIPPDGHACALRECLCHAMVRYSSAAPTLHPQSVMAMVIFMIRPLLIHLSSSICTQSAFRRG